MADYPLVTVICTNYNQGRFLRECILSVINQTYPAVEIILCDDASTDGSRNIISELIYDFPQIHYIQNSENLGLCKSFNRSLSLANGHFIIDLAGDDILEPERIRLGVKLFQEEIQESAVQYTRFTAIDISGKEIPFHIPRNEGLCGDIYTDVIQYYFINAATVMSRKKVFDELKGYDENLTFEDFDFWVRSSRLFAYSFIDKPLVKKRSVPDSLSSQQEKYKNIHTKSTYMVCKKILKLNRNKKEHAALFSRCLYESKKSLKLLDFTHFIKFLILACRSIYFLLSSPNSMLK